jgi:hypothetical protein
MQIINGTSYNTSTPADVIRILEASRRCRTRLRIHYGSTDGPDAGRDWLEECDVEGYVGRSCGPVKIPILVHNARSIGGAGILDARIVRIRSARAGSPDLYRHERYHTGSITLKTGNIEAGGKIFGAEIRVNERPHARFKDENAARTWLKKMGLSL